MATGTNPDETRAYNRRAVLDIVRRGGLLSRTEIAAAASLTLPAVSTIVGELVAEGLVADHGRRTTGRGQPPVEYALAADGAYALGVALDRDHLTALLVDLAGEVRARVDTPWSLPDPEDGVAEIRAAIDALLGTLPPAARERVRGLGIAVPGRADETDGRLDDVVSMPTWEGFPLAGRLEPALERPVRVANDGTLAAVGESVFGIGRSTGNFFYVLFALGLGGGLIANREPYGGVWGATGRFGHIPVATGDAAKSCAVCGESGCLGLYASFEALAPALRESGVAATDAAALTALHAAGDARLLGWLEEAARHLVHGLRTVENLLDPEAIVFDGRLPRPLLEHLLRSLERRLPPGRPHGRRPRLVAGTRGSDAAAFGAASLPIYRAFTPKYDLLLRHRSR